MSTVLPPPPAAENPYAAPAARIDDAPAGELVLAGRGTRLGAAIVDNLILVGPAVLLSVMLPGLVGGDASSVPYSDVTLALLGFGSLAVMLVALVVNLVLLHRNGQTIGKRLLGIRIVRSNGDHCALSRIIVARWLPLAVVGMIPVIGPIVGIVDALLIFRDNHRCLHDEIADTIVVVA